MDWWNVQLILKERINIYWVIHKISQFPQQIQYNKASEVGSFDLIFPTIWLIFLVKLGKISVVIASSYVFLELVLEHIELGVAAEIGDTAA